MILLSPGSVIYPTVNYFRSLVIHALGIFSQHVTTNITHDLQHSIIIIHCILEITRSDITFPRILEIPFFQRNDLLHQGMSQVELQILVICIEICHTFFNFRFSDL